MSINPQLQSAFITRLPTEVRDAIYLELWRSNGLRQHILWHGLWQDNHLCSWPCTTKYEVDDRLQRDIEELRRRMNVPLGERMRKSQDPETATYVRRLQSPWINHWACGERAEQEHGLGAVDGFTTSDIVCWRRSRVNGQHVPPRSPYLPMLLTCKLM
ncbi:uncharacterized protein DNG_05818 [Cephalotrichum gorgonifer]|uniref:Uncharacterized protein n=1 Tax=Cephalotrichum gorgonifer TaxID=2041049 RepID=A0AAE8SVU4_9PEZI|nr:uncharacterized protein DNG_05818 [Cephalotrichum gorgonifer]